MSGTHGLLPESQQTGYYYITLEETYVTMFKISAERLFERSAKDEQAEQKRKARNAHAVAKAYISDVLLNLSNTVYHERGSEKNIWVFLSFPQLEERLHGACKMRVLKDAMKELVEDGYVSKRPNRDPRYKALEYRLNLAKYRKELAALPRKVDKDDSADLHDDSADLHDDSADLHDDSADLHAIHNINKTKNKHTKESASVAASPSDEKSSEEEKAYQQRAEYWQDYINQRRGGALRKSKEVKAESQSLLDLVKEFTDEQIAAIDKHLATESWKYKKNPCEIGGEVLLNESRPVWSLIKDKVAPKRQENTPEGTEPAPRKLTPLEERNRELAAKFGLNYGISRVSAN